LLSERRHRIIKYVGAASKARAFKILRSNTDDSKWARGNYHGNLKGPSINSFFSATPPKSPEGGLIGKSDYMTKSTPYKSPFGGFRGRTAIREKKT
jgi:hypothetical protein